MKTRILFSIMGLSLLFVLSSCNAIKYLQIVDGSKSDGTLTMVYEYGIFEKPIVQWDQAKQNAINKCQSWGYKSAEFFDAGVTQCIGYDQYGSCVRWRVIYKCQCTN